ncbi:MAG: hypothetical protein Devi2KO_07080 [Devosia indica]
MIAVPRLGAKQINRLIARVLVAKPQASVSEVRTLLPQLDRIGDHDLEQKLSYLRDHARPIALSTRKR